MQSSGQTPIDVFPSADSFGSFVALSDDQVLKDAATNGWTENEVEWLDQRIAHYNRTLGVSLKRCFVQLEHPSALADIGIAGDVIYIPVAQSFSPQILETYIDWVLLHEPMHRRQRELLGIDDSSIKAFVSSGGELSIVLRGARDWETKYSIPPLRALCSLLPEQIETLGILVALDLHADSRTLRDGHMLIPPLLDEEAVHGVTPQAKLLAQCVLHCASEMNKVQVATTNGHTAHISHIPYLARFHACLQATGKLCSTLDATQVNGFAWWLRQNATRLAQVLETSGAGRWLLKNATSNVARHLTKAYDAVVTEFAAPNDLHTLYVALSRTYTDILLLATNRRPYLPHLSVLGEALADTDDALMRERAADYLTEVGNFEALGMLSSQMQKEKDPRVLKTLISSMRAFAHAYPREALKALKSFRTAPAVGLTTEFDTCIAQTTREVLSSAVFRAHLSAGKWRALAKQAEALLNDIAAIHTDAWEAGDEPAQEILLALPLLGASSMTVFRLERLAESSPHLAVQAITSIGSCFAHDYWRITRREPSGRRPSRWHFNDHDVGAADEELMASFLNVIHSLERLMQSKREELRDGTLAAIERMAEDLSKCGLVIKEECWALLTEMVTSEPNPHFQSRAILLIGAIFQPWYAADSSDRVKVVVETSDGESVETGYELHRTSVAELNHILAAYDDICTVGGANSAAMIAEGIGRWMSDRLRHSGSSDRSNGMYASIAWRFVESLERFGGRDVRLACADAAARLSVLVPAESFDVIYTCRRFLCDADARVRAGAAKAIQDTLFFHREYVSSPPTEGERRVYNAIAGQDLHDEPHCDDVQQIIDEMRLRWDREIERSEAPDIAIPDASESKEVRENQLDRLESLAHASYSAPVDKKRRLMEAVVKYCLSETSPALRAKAVQIVFAPLIIHEVDVDEAFPPMQLNDDGSVTERLVMHPDSVAELEAILDYCKMLIDDGDDVIQRTTLRVLGQTFGDSQFLSTAGGKGCSSMAFEFMTQYTNNPSKAVRMGLAEGAVRIYNTLVGMRDGPSDLILSLLRDEDSDVSMCAAAATLRTIDEYGKESSYARNIALDVCVPALQLNIYSQAVREAFAGIDVEAADIHLQDLIRDAGRNMRGMDERLSAVLAQRAKETSEMHQAEVIDALGAASEDARALALQTVASERISSAGERIVHICQSTTSRSERREGVRTLGYISSEEGINYLIRCLSDKDHIVANYAARGLGRLRSSRAVAELVTTGLTSRFRSVVASSVEALGRILCRKNASLFPADFETKLKKLANGGSPRVARKCREVLRRMKEGRRGRKRRKRSTPSNPPTPRFDIDESDVPF